MDDVEPTEAWSKVAESDQFSSRLNRRIKQRLVDIFRQLDDKLYKSSGTHFMHFPDSVITMCYYCNFDEEVAKLTHDWNDTIPNLLNEPANKFSEAKSKFESVFK